MTDQDTNRRGLAIIKAAEGFRSRPYYCPAGVLTIGYGTTEAAGVNIRGLDLPITEAAAEAMLALSLDQLYEPAVENSVKVPLTSNQFSALVSFVYNVGGSAFHRSTLLRRLNSRDYQGAANELLRWTRAAGRVLPGLVKRRRAERELFLTPDAVEEEVAGRLEQDMAEEIETMPQRVEKIEQLDTRPLAALSPRFEISGYLAHLTQLPVPPVLSYPLS